MRAACLALALTFTPLAPAGTPAQGRSVQDFFRDFTAEWIRGNPIRLPPHDFSRANSRTSSNAS
jgi:hypothetical protein